MKPKILSKKLSYKGNWFKTEETIVRLTTGKVAKWERIIIPDGVVIVPIDKEKNIYLSKEWRVAWEKEILQLPAGQCNGKTKKEILKQARNELREEIGLDAKKWKKLITCGLSSRERGKIHIFLAQNLFDSKKAREDGEIIEVVKMPFKKAYQLLFRKKVLTTSYTLLGMVLAKEALKL